jgi:hypothetical protein
VSSGGFANAAASKMSMAAPSAPTCSAVASKTSTPPRRPTESTAES